MNLHLVAGAVGVILLTGCSATLNVARFDQVSRATSSHVEVFTSHAAIKRPYKEIAIITAQEGWDDTETKLTQLMIQKAKSIGADAVILLDAKTETSGGMLLGATYLAANFNKTKCSAIVFTDK